MLRGQLLKHWALLIFAISLVLGFVSCGGSNNNPSLNKGSRVQHRSFISNTYSGNLQAVNTQNDTTNYNSATTSTGQTVQALPVSITVGSSVTWMTVSPDQSITAVYDQVVQAVDFINNSSEANALIAPLGAKASMALFSPDGKALYVPESNLLITGSRNGGIQAISLADGSVAATFAVPSVTTIALSPDGHTLLGFASNSDSVFVLNLQATPIAAVEVPGFARPVNAFFLSSDSNTAFILNCGWECGSATTAASVAQFDIPSQTIKATVIVGGASVGLLSSNMLYVAGTSQTAGPVFDIVNVANMTRTTANSVAINDGFHTTMVLTTNNKIYIGAVTCTNQTTGCLSIVDPAAGTEVPNLPPNGPVTGMLAIANRDVAYVVEGGLFNMYDTDTNLLEKKQIHFSGALYSVVQVDPE